MPATTAKRHSRDEAEIRKLIADWSKALENRDIDGLTANYAPDMLLFDAIPPYQTRGAAAYRALWEACLPCFPAKFKSERRDLTIWVDGNVAFVHCLHRTKMGGKNHPASQTWLRITVCYRRTRGKWRVVHEHVSLPFDLMSGKAVYITNLKTASSDG